MAVSVENLEKVQYYLEHGRPVMVVVDVAVPNNRGMELKTLELNLGKIAGVTRDGFTVTAGHKVGPIKRIQTAYTYDGILHGEEIIDKVNDALAPKPPARGRQRIKLQRR